MRYAIDIDEVVLHGFGRVDRRALAAGLSDELGRLVVRGALPAAAGDRPRIDGGHVTVAPDNDRTTGRGIAGAVYAGLIQ